MSANGKPKVEMAEVLKKLKPQTLSDASLSKSAPVLYDLLAQRWKDGKCTRQAGQLSIKPDGSVYKVIVQCPTEGVQTIVYLESIVNLVESLESRLSDPKQAWTMTYARARKALPTVDD